MLARTDVVGREDELAAVERFLARIPDGLAALVIDGEAGIGKTTVWAAATELATREGFRVLSCRPAESEAKLSFAALADVLAPVADEILPGLPLPQREALEVALLRSTADHGPLDQRAVGTGFVTALGRLAQSGTVLVAIDDVQWLDGPSRRVLEFAARRLRELPVGILVAKRAGSDQSVPLGLDRVTTPERFQEVPLGPLSLGALHHVIRTRLDLALPRPTLVRVERVSGGNPFYAIEIALEVARSEVTPELAVPETLKEVLNRRITRLPPPTREALLAAAALSRPTVAQIEQQGDALEPAVEDGVIEVSEGRVRFSHPLLASVVYSSASQSERRALHRRLAEQVDELEERARHRALGADGPDEETARLLHEAAIAARNRAAPDTATEFAELALRLAENDDLSTERKLLLGWCLFQTGDTARADAVFESAAAAASGAARAETLMALAATRYWSEGARAAVRWCEEALLAAAGHPALEARCHVDLAAYLDFDLRRSDQHAQTALQILEAIGANAEPKVLSEALGIAARDSLVSGRGLPLELIERAVEVAPEVHGTPVGDRIGTALGQWLKYVDDFDRSRTYLEEARVSAIEEGDESALPNVLQHLAQLECWSGNWALASRYAEESCDLADQLGQTFGGPPAYRALVDAHVGRVDRARSTLNERLEAVERNPLAMPLYLRTLGFVELSQGDPVAAERYLTRALEAAEEIGVLEPGVMRIHADAVEALVATGELERADELLRRFEGRARTIGLAWSLATSARCRALLLAARGDLEGAIGSVERALIEHERLPMPFELGRTLLVEGQLRRRANQRRAAREAIERALGIFDELGAPLWAERAAAELRRVPIRRGASDELTENEERVAELAASGKTNREVAQELFLSPKTVEANLSRVYRKLGIRSRAELGARMAERERAAKP